MNDPSDAPPAFELAPSALKGIVTFERVSTLAFGALAIFSGTQSEDPVRSWLLIGMGVTMLLAMVSAGLTRFDRIGIGMGGMILSRRGRTRTVDWKDVSAARLEWHFRAAHGFRWKIDVRDGPAVHLPYMGMSESEWENLCRAMIETAGGAGVPVTVSRYTRWLFGIKRQAGPARQA